ncbi:MAG TPA: hypothetical protein VLE49_19410 [Anaerolineales bacterium]|nr:hypothetical protein [Anaerolineales bacterium]
METPPISPAPVPEEPKKNNTALIIGIVAAVLLCCCCLGIVGIYLYQNGDQIFGTGALLQQLLS